jgi:hypothetical protein
MWAFSATTSSFGFHATVFTTIHFTSPKPSIENNRKMEGDT